MVDIRTKIMLVDNCTKCTLYALRCSHTKIVVILYLSGNLKRADHLADGGTLTLVSAHKFCVRVCVRACVRACVRVCVCVCVCVCDDYRLNQHYPIKVSVYYYH